MSKPTFKIICDYRENFKSKTFSGFFNDHQDRNTFEKINREILKLGFDCEIFGGVRELMNAYAKDCKCDKNSIYINLSDGLDTQYSRVQIPVLCDLLRLKYSGCGPFEAALATNKFYSNLAVKNLDYLTPSDILFNRCYICEQEIHIEKYPVIVKPNCEGSSLGITHNSVCSDKTQVLNVIQELSPFFAEFLIEEYIQGYDITNFVIGNNRNIVLNEVLAIKHHNKLIFETEVLGVDDHINKSRIFLPAEKYLPKELIQKIKHESVTIMEKLHIKDICRIDYRVTENGDIYFLEINTVPAIHEESQAGAICKNKQIPFSEFIEFFLKSI